MNAISRNSGHWFLGIVVLIIGVIFLLENLLGLEIWDRIWLFWPVVFILWGLVELFQKKSIFFSIILLAIGSIFLLKNFELYVLPESIWKYWPIIIIAIGFDKIFRRDDDSVKFTGSIKKKKGKIEMITQDEEII